MRSGVGRAAAAAVVATALTLAAVGTAHAEASYGEIALTGSGGDYSGTVTLPPGSRR
jgi:hypothetical protein